MKSLTKKLIISISELLLGCIVLASATYAFFAVTRKVNTNNMVMSVETIGDIYIKDLEDINAQYTKTFILKWKKGMSLPLLPQLIV